MVLTQEHLKSLKRVNVSKNTDKTKERIQQDYKAASKDEKNAILELSGQGANSIYRIYTTGTITARILLAFAQTLNIQPWYYSGEIDERESLDEGQLLQFLKVHGYDDLLKEMNKKRKYNQKPKDEPVTDDVTDKTEITTEDEPASTSTDKSELPDDAETEEALEITLLFNDEPKMKKAVEELTEQEAVELLHALFIRAKGGSESEFIADVVKRCLLK